MLSSAEGDRLPALGRLRPLRGFADAHLNPVDTDEFAGSIGIPLASTDQSIPDTDGKEVPLGEAGELFVKGPQVMTGYWHRPDETANCPPRRTVGFGTGDMA